MKNRVSILIIILLLSSYSAHASAPHADTILIKTHLTAITKTNGFRTYNNTALLDKTADYIYNHFQKHADTTYYQEYTANGRTYKNVICKFRSKNNKKSKKIIVVGAHYDVCTNQEGADDNASGVTGLLELVRLLKVKDQKQKLNHDIELVAYTLEEPPYFRTEFMGSYIHAKSLTENKTDVYGMISLEMIGYFKDHKNSQSYPVSFLKWFYGNKGDFITLTKKFFPGKFARKFSSKFKSTKAVKTKQFSAPKFVPGIDFSDHLNYWKFGFSALMITDTAFYRNKNYHEPTDTLETLDLKRMAKVIYGVFGAIVSLK